MDQLERLLAVASGEELSAKAGVAVWTSARTADLGAVLQKLLRGYTDTAISVTSSLITSITRFAVQASTHIRTFTCILRCTHVESLATSFLSPALPSRLRTSGRTSRILWNAAIALLFASRRQQECGICVILSSRNRMAVLLFLLSNRLVEVLFDRLAVVPPIASDRLAVVLIGMTMLQLLLSDGLSVGGTGWQEYMRQQQYCRP